MVAAVDDFPPCVDLKRSIKATNKIIMGSHYKTPISMASGCWQKITCFELKLTCDNIYMNFKWFSRAGKAAFSHFFKPTVTKQLKPSAFATKMMQK